MPYISKDKRDFYKEEIESLAGKLSFEGVESESETSIDPGDLSYVVFKLMKMLSEPKGYQNYSRLEKDVRDAVGEFHRKEVEPYEDRKIFENGDI